MAHDDEFIIGGRKRKSSSSQGTPRTTNSRGGGSSHPEIKLGKISGSFTKRLAKDMAIAKRSSGRKSYAKPSHARVTDPRKSSFQLSRFPNISQAA